MWQVAARQGRNKDQPNEKNQRLFYSELATPKESATISCILADTQRQAEEWEKGKALGMS